MKEVDFEVRAGKPTEVVVHRPDGTDVALFLTLSVLDVLDPGVVGADGFPRYTVNFSLNIVQQPKALAEGAE